MCYLGVYGYIPRCMCYLGVYGYIPRCMCYLGVSGADTGFSEGGGVKARGDR